MGLKQCHSTPLYRRNSIRFVAYVHGTVRACHLRIAKTRTKTLTRTQQHTRTARARARYVHTPHEYEYTHT